MFNLQLIRPEKQHIQGFKLFFSQNLPPLQLITAVF